MTRLLLFIKHNLRFLWTTIEFLNGFIFSLLYGKRLKIICAKYLPTTKSKVVYRKIDISDLDALSLLLNNNVGDFEFFKPHDFDVNSLTRLHNNPSFLMMTCDVNNTIAGYFFLRFFSNRSAFIGRMVDSNYQGQGISKPMSILMYNITRELGFKCFTTISKQNTKIVNLHNTEGGFKIIKALPNDYLLVEIDVLKFVEDDV